MNNKPKTGWRQKDCKTFYLIPSRPCFFILFMVFALINGGLGTFLFIESNNLSQESKRYDNITGCKSPAEYSSNGNSCTFTVSLDIEGPVYIYYELTNYYQNHRKYMKSRSLVQLGGESVSGTELDNCDPIKYYKDLENPSAIPAGVSEDAAAFPCGLIAWSIFGDTYTINNDANLIDSSDIMWKSDEDRYQNLADPWQSQQWQDIETGPFAVWMRVAATSNVKKLLGVVKQDMKGTYTLRVNVQTDLSSFSGQKWLVFQNTNDLGGKNTVLAYTCITGSIISLIWVVLLALRPKNREVSPEDEVEGELSY